MASLFDYIDVRLQLLKAEAGEVASFTLRGILFLLAGLFCMIGAHLTAMAALILWLARTWWQGDVLPALAVVAGGHLVIAMLAFWAARYYFTSRPFFRHTLQELQTDKSWIQEAPSPT
jgi:uncharacterized membrane protein YqjE